MPCQSDYSCSRASDQRELDKVTRVCCDMRTILRREGLLGELTQESLKWIAQHDAEDAKRIAEEEAEGKRERTKQRALKKLSLEERRVLGL